jgi:hypothetical protein
MKHQFMSTIDPSELLKPPTSRTYRLRVKVVLHRDYVKDLGRTFERTMALLVPQESDQRQMFLTAWLPDLDTEHHEVVGFLKSPVDSPLRLSVHRRDKRYFETHYCFVMTKGVEDVLVEHCEGKILDLDVYPETYDEVADAPIRDANGSYDLI